MNWIRTVGRFSAALLCVFLALFAVVAVGGSLVLPPDPFAQLYAAAVAAVVAAPVAAAYLRAGRPLRDLAAFVAAVRTGTVAVAVGVVPFAYAVGAVGATSRRASAALTGVALLGVAAADVGAYLLVYREWSRRARARLSVG